MRHRDKKVKFQKGKDANEMLMRKLAVNFLEHGHMVTTEKKAKAIKPFLEKCVNKAKRNAQSNHNMLKRHFVDKRHLEALVTQVAPALKSQTSGYLRLKRLEARGSDGAMMMRVEWAFPVLITWKKEKKAKEAKKPAPKEEVRK